jgi:hypothetical protein
MVGIFKKKSRVKRIYSEENAYFLNIDITDFYDYRTGEHKNLSYQQAYQIGKKLYERKFGPLVGSDLSTIMSNLMSVYSDETLEEKNEDEIDRSDIGNVITFLGKNAWVSHQCWEFFKSAYREKFGVPEQIVSEEKLRKFFKDYSYEDQLSAKNLYKLTALNEIKRTIRRYVDDLKKIMYNEKDDTWHDIDITHEFMQIRLLMIDISNPIPAFVWNLIDGNPFYHIYDVCRDYMKWKNSLNVYKEVFKNICLWESGRLFSGDEIISKYEEGLWVNWNRIGQDFISSKETIAALDGGIRWLQEDFSDHIRRRKIFYDQFTPDNNLIFSEDMVQSLNKI